MTDTTTLARRNGDADLAPYTGDALTPLYGVAEAVAGMHQLQAFVNTYLVPSKAGTTNGDYGIIPGTGDKPTLLKSGADKLCDVYGLRPVYEVLAREVDPATGGLAYEIQCRLLRKGTETEVGAGLGACDSRETRYQSSVWWNEPGEPPAGQGWARIQTKKGVSWKRKVPNENPADLRNTILKMAKKRALVDAVLSVTRSSGLFTQDLEDAATPDVTPASEGQHARLDKAFAALAWDAAGQLTYLREMLTRAAADVLLADLRVRYQQARAKAPAADPETGEIQEGEVLGETPAPPAPDPYAVARSQARMHLETQLADAVRVRGLSVGQVQEFCQRWGKDHMSRLNTMQLTQALADLPTWQPTQPYPDPAAVPPADPDAEFAALATERDALDARLRTALAACGRDYAKTVAGIIKKRGRAWADLPLDVLEQYCEYYEGEAETIQQPERAEAQA